MERLRGVKSNVCSGIAGSVWPWPGLVGFPGGRKGSRKPLPCCAGRDARAVPQGVGTDALPAKALEWHLRDAVPASDSRL